jgi:hypothetical protein
MYIFQNVLRGLSTILKNMKDRKVLPKPKLQRDDKISPQFSPTPRTMDDILYDPEAITEYKKKQLKHRRLEKLERLFELALQLAEEALIELRAINDEE